MATHRWLSPAVHLSIQHHAQFLCALKCCVTMMDHVLFYVNPSHYPMKHDFQISQNNDALSY